MKAKLAQLTWICAALLVGWFLHPAIAEARGCGGGGCSGGRARPRPTGNRGVAGAPGQDTSDRSDRSAAGAATRVAVDWTDFKLALPGEAGYGDTAAPLEDLVGRAAKRAAGRAPALVLIVDEFDTRRNDAVEKCFRDEKLAIALGRFVCLRATIQSIPDDEMRAEVRRRTPLVYTFDPAGGQVALLQGKRTGSRSTIASVVQKAFRLSYAISLKKYTRLTLNLLERRDRIAVERLRITGKLANAKGRRKAALERELERLESATKDLLEKEKELHQQCSLRSEFSPTEAATK
jgi:hypothetical protein